MLMPNQNITFRESESRDFVEKKNESTGVYCPFCILFYYNKFHRVKSIKYKSSGRSERELMLRCSVAQWGTNQIHISLLFFRITKKRGAAAKKLCLPESSHGRRGEQFTRKKALPASD